MLRVFRGSSFCKQTDRSRQPVAFPTFPTGELLCAKPGRKLLSHRFVRWCNGSTRPFGGLCPGSNPGRTAIPPCFDLRFPILDFPRPAESFRQGRAVRRGRTRSCASVPAKSGHCHPFSLLDKPFTFRHAAPMTERADPGRFEGLIIRGNFCNCAGVFPM